MGQRRNSDVELCFDSMTDLITNLAGGLMLVVLLLMGLTREAPKAAEPRAHGADAPRAERSHHPLVERLDTLKPEIDSVNTSLVEAEQNLERLEKVVAAMQTEAKAAPPPAGGPEKK